MAQCLGAAYQPVELKSGPKQKKEGTVAEERLKLAVFIDFDNIQIGVKDTLGKEFDVAVVLEALKERGEVMTKVAYGDWPRASEHSRQMTQHAIQMVQRNVTPRGDKNGADINLALDALEMAFTRHHINGFAIVGGDSDFIALVEKLKQYDKRVFVVGGRAFTSNILQRNCTEFIAYENLLSTPENARPSRSRRGDAPSRSTLETRPLSEALPNIRRALQILADRGVAPQLGLLKSTVLQLDSTFSERDYSAGSFLEFMQKMERERLVHLRRTERGFLVEPKLVESKKEVEPKAAAVAAEADPSESEGEPTTAAPEDEVQAETGSEAPSNGGGPSGPTEESTAQAMEKLRQALAAAGEKAPNRPLYMRQIRQALRSIDPTFDERRLGFRGILDLLHQAQRENSVRLQRDRKGVWRVFPVSAAAPTAAAPGTQEPVTEAATGTVSPASEPVVQAEAAASTDFWESPEVVSATPATPIEEAPLGSTFVETTAVEAVESSAAETPEEAPPATRKTKRARAAGGRSKSSAKKSASRRKAKDTHEP
jgi:uncharacterized LabA/DUF88 family protein